MTTALVTGGAGFIGSNYVRHVLEHTEDQVTAVEPDAIDMAADEVEAAEEEEELETELAEMATAGSAQTADQGASA